MFDAILLLAGKGERSGLEYNKVLFKLNDKPLFLYSLETFLKCRDCRKMILVCREEEIQTIQTLLSGYQKIDYAIGGEQRQDSVKAGIARTESDIALIHDGARPFVKKRSEEHT
ncbi:MAG: 2-C-methyl-D-erythritol 4-phosphate cytidylyltransferase, partial [Bacilli bacterium]|nr:2-C-methyl-D-erythritol 4-phosphate cytidylyltransferase [Bacilli bacterium]